MERKQLTRQSDAKEADLRARESVNMSTAWANHIDTDSEAL
jgi:hypothetical protein